MNAARSLSAARAAKCFEAFQVQESNEFLIPVVQVRESDEQLLALPKAMR